jgi:serine/threonine protein kinase
VVYEQIGLGGMATVHRAETQGIAGFSKQVALKRMLPSVAADANLVKSFIREARLASHLRHANVAQTYDLGKVGDTYFIAMELVPGLNLREILKHCAMCSLHMPLAVAMNIVNQIGDALDYAHNLCDDSGQPLGIIHRDVSPANVIVSEGGVVKLIDFGIAKASGGGMQTLSGMIKGKFSYLAPECLNGDVDARSDLFALGVIAYELLTSRPLFQGNDDMDTLYRVKNMPIVPPSRINPQVPPEIEAIIMTALERDPEKRWQRATAMRQAMTTETQRLGLVAHNAQVEDWIARAFQQQFHEESEPSIVISRSSVELAQGTVPDDFREQTDDEIKTIIKPSGSKPQQAQQQQWHVGTDAPTFDQEEPLHEQTLTDEQPVRDFQVSTVIEQPSAKLLEQSASDWNSPSVVTVHDRPRLSDWNTSHTAQTREVRPPSIVERRGSSPHTIQRGSGSTPALRVDGSGRSNSALRVDGSGSHPATDDVPTLTQPRTDRASAPPVNRTLLGQTGPAPILPSGARTGKHPSQQPPTGAPLSGARTAPVLILDADAARTDVNVSASAVLHSTDVSAVLADLDERSSVAKPPKLGRRRGGGLLLALLVLIAAGGAAAVVYFALPYLT